MRFARVAALNSLSMRVLLAYVAGMVLSIVLLVLTAVLLLRGDVLARMDLQDAAADMATLIAFDAQGRPVALQSDEDDMAWVFESLRHEAAYRVLDDMGQTVLLSPAGTTFWPVGNEAPQLTQGRFDFTYDDTAFHGATAPIQRDGRTWYFQIAGSTRLMKLLHRVALPLVGAGIGVFSLVLLVTFGLCAYLTLRYTLGPLRAISESAMAISPRSLHARLKTDSIPTEIAPLVDSFNRTLERLEHGYRLQQEFLGNAAHELKTPLALIRAQIELREVGASDPDTRKALLSDVEYMTRQVQQLLLLAEASEVNNYRFTAVGLREAAEEAVAYLQRKAEAASVHLTLSDTAVGMSWQADRGALFTLLKNLLENAIQHAPAATPVSVELLADAVTVRDWGPGVDAAQLPLLFERFWRATHRRDHGAGLGLAICQEIALVHGWSLTAERAEPGLRFRLTRDQGNEAHP